MIIRNKKTTTALYKGTKEIVKRYKGTLVVYEAFKNLLASGVLPLTLTKCKGVNLVDYKVYGESVQEGTPTPEAPVEVESVGERTKNLFNKNAVGEANNLWWNGVYLYGYMGWYPTDYIPVKAGETYTISGKTVITQNYVSLFDENKTFISQYGWASGRSYTIPDNVAYVGISIHSDDLDTFQVELGDLTDYESYGYKIPVKASGKNLFNIEQYSSYIDISKYEAGDNLVISTKDQYLFKIASSAGASSSIQVTGTYMAFTMTQEYKNIGKLHIISTKTYGYETKDNLLNQNVQLEYGAEPTEFESYVEPITTNIYLNEPLRKVGDYADYIDFENSKVIRNVGQIINNGSEEWNGYSSGVGYRTENTLFIDGKPVICNMFVNSQTLVKTYAIRKNFGNLYCFGLSDEYPTADDWKTFLSSNNMEVIGALNTPTEETIELPNIPTIKGTTILSVDTTIQPSNVEVIYKGK